MSVIRLTKEFSFEMAHSLSGYDGACREIHGHSYKLFVTVQGEPNADPNNPKYGMVMDFGELKRIVGRLIVDRYDHALVVRRTAENSDAIDALRCCTTRLRYATTNRPARTWFLVLQRRSGANFPRESNCSASNCTKRLPLLRSGTGRTISRLS